MSHICTYRVYERRIFHIGAAVVCIGREDLTNFSTQFFPSSYVFPFSIRPTVYAIFVKCTHPLETKKKNENGSSVPFSCGRSV